MISKENLPLYSGIEIANKNREELNALPDTPFRIEFEDGEIVTTKARTIWSWLLWKIHREFRLTPLLKSHHIGRKSLSPETHIEILSNIKADFRKVYNEDGSDRNMMRINELIHESFNEMYNDLTIELEPYVLGANALEILQVLKHPTIKEANQSLYEQPNIDAGYIDSVHKKIAKVLQTDDSLRKNSVAIAYKCKLANVKQLLQCVSARGFMTEVDGTIFKKPMLEGYAQGMRSLYSYACESRMASLSAFSTAGTMRDFQYINRSFQILNSDLRNIVYKDCGTTSHTVITVDTMDKLAEMQGKYIKGEFDEWKLIDHTDKSLLNKPLKVRMLVDCKHPDRHTVCMNCIGELHTGYIATDSLGQQTTAHVQQKQSQDVLSTKHYAANSFDFITYLPKEYERFFHQPVGDEANLYITKFLKENKGCILFKEHEIENINNLSDTNDISQITPSRYAKLTQVYARYTKDNSEFTEWVQLEHGASFASLSVPALKYIVNKGWSIDEQGNYCVLLDEWNIKKPFIQYPRKKIDMVAVGKSIDTFLKGGKTKKDTNGNNNVTVTQFTDFGQAIMAFQDIAIPHTRIKMSHMEIMVYGLLANDPSNYDYRLPDPLDRKKAVFVSHPTKVSNSNVAVAMAYESQGMILADPASYVINKHSYSGYEWFVVGGEKIKKE